MRPIKDVSQIIELTEIYRKHRHLSLQTVSKYASGRGAFFGDLFSGRCGITINRRDKIVTWFSDHWPDSQAPWPRDIPRPETKPNNLCVRLPAVTKKSMRSESKLFPLPPNETSRINNKNTTALIVKGQVQPLLTLLDLYKQHTGLSHWRISYLVRGDGQFFKRLREGGGCAARTASFVIQWFSEHWPDSDVFWPDNIPRPAAKRTKANGNRTRQNDGKGRVAR